MTKNSIQDRPRRGSRISD